MKALQRLRLLGAGPFDPLVAEAAAEIADDIINQDIDRRVREQITRLAVDLMGQRRAVLDYLLTLACSNCDHVHEGAPCGTVDAEGQPACRCDWQNDIAREVRDLLGAG